MENFLLKFGKHKGTYFLQTPKSYQNWLLSQDWFKPQTIDPMAQAQKQFSNAYKKLGSWNGYSSRGQAVYDSMFEAEKAMDDAYYNDPCTYSTRYNGEW